MSDPDPHIIMAIAKALGYDARASMRYNNAIIEDANKVWAALIREGFVEDRVDIGASGHCEALVLMFKHRA